MLYDNRVQVTIWLTICATMVLGMVILGGAVRVTGSGLSMVDWQPLLGVLPPLGNAAWQEVFAAYRASPEGTLVNADISMSRFQFIFYMEYFHRILGRLIGVVYFLPLCWFLMRGGLPGPLKSRLWVLFVLGGLQGLMGWYMVKSGLVDDPHVSQYRLTAHLLLAVVIFMMMIRVIVGLWADRQSDVALASRLPAGLVLALVVLMIGSGGMMAGTRAGHIFNTWPLMGDQLLPQMLLALEPWWRNLFENTLTIQFVHRWLAFVVAAGVIWMAAGLLRHESDPTTRRLAGLSIVLVAIQLLLGISTLVSGVPAVLAVAHQGTGLLLTGVVTGIWSLRRTTLAAFPAR